MCLSYTGRLYISKDVIFNESKFPFHELFPKFVLKGHPTKGVTLSALPFNHHHSAMEYISSESLATASTFKSIRSGSIGLPACVSASLCQSSPSHASSSSSSSSSIQESTEFDVSPASTKSVSIPLMAIPAPVIPVN